MMYTIMPPELIWENDDAGENRVFLEVELEGVRMVVEPGKMGRAKIVRLLSSDPGDYLRPEFQPGNEVFLG